MTHHVREVEKLEHNKPLYCVYDEHRLVAGFVKEKTANAYVSQLRIVRRRHAQK